MIKLPGRAEVITVLAMLYTTVYSHNIWNRITPPEIDSVTNISVAPSDTGVIYLSVLNDAVWRSEGNQYEWVKTETFGGCEGVKHLSIHPSDPTELYLTSGG